MEGDEREPGHSTEQTARETLRAQIAMGRELGVAKDASAINGLTARNVLHEELGRFGEPVWNYQLDERTRDTLIAHARQDAAHALANSVSMLAMAAKIRRLLFAALALLLVILWRVFTLSR